MHESEASQGVMGLGCNAGRVKNKHDGKKARHIPQPKLDDTN